MNEKELKSIVENISTEMIAEQCQGYKNSYSPKLTEKINLYNYVIDLKQALNDIREYCNNQKKAINPKNMNVGKLNLEIDDSTMAIYNTVGDILQIIDKVLGDNNGNK